MRPYTLVVAMLCLVDSTALGLIGLPLAHIFVILLVLPEPIPLHHPILKISDIVFFLICQKTLPVRLVVAEIPHIDGAVSKPEVPLTQLMIQTEPALKNSMLRYKHSPSMLHRIIRPSKINKVLILYYHKPAFILELLLLSLIHI